MAVTSISLLSLVCLGQTPPFSMDYPVFVQGKAVPVNPTFTAQYKALPKNSKPAGDWTKCVNKTDWALTFDDGPSQFTPALLQDLKSRNVKATFFVVGSQVKLYPQILKQVADAGHEVGIHTWSHVDLTTLSDDQVISEIMYTYNIIKDVTGISTRYFRAPYGSRTQAQADMIKTLGFDIIKWDLDTNDWKSDGNSSIPSFKKWLAMEKTGHISLQHDLYKGSASVGGETAGLVVQGGYRPVLMTGCMGWDTGIRFGTATTSPGPTSTGSSAATGTSTKTPNSAEKATVGLGIFALTLLI